MRARRAAAVIVGLVCVAVGIHVIAIRPELTATGAFLFADEGHNLWLAEVLLRGGQLYVDAYSPYGPVPAWLYAAAAAVAGNSPTTYLALMLACSTAAIVLVHLALSRYLSAGRAFVWTLLALIPTMLAPGSLLGGLTVSPYVCLERVVIAGAVFMWQPLRCRSMARAVGLGLLLGTLQGVKFGPAPVLVAALALADLLEAVRGHQAIPWGRLTATAGAALGVELALVLWAVTSLTPAVAYDVLWPQYLLDVYAWVTPDLRWPALGNWRVVVGQYGPPAVGLGLSALAVLGRRRQPEHIIAAWLVFVFALGAVILFKHAFHFRQYAWLLAAGGGFALSGMSTRRWVIAAGLALPAMIVCGRSLLAPSPGLIRVNTPNIGSVYVTPAEAGVLSTLAQLRAESPDQRSVVGAPHMAGWHTAFGVSTLSRHTWFQRGMVRPWEADAIASRFSEAGAIAICPLGMPIKDAMYLPDSVQRALEAHLPRVAVEGSCTIRRR